jgi:hypothetical protein
LQEARALLGRYEYQKGNIEAALHVFEGIDITAVTPKIKQTLARRGERHKRHSQNYATQPMSIHAASLLLEAVFLKAKSLQGLGRFKGISFVLIHRFAICFLNSSNLLVIFARFLYPQIDFICCSSQ